MWFGGFTVVLSALMEFVMGNTFSFVLFMGYGTPRRSLYAFSG
jgi:succinate-acetate transporter protein